MSKVEFKKQVIALCISKVKKSIALAESVMLEAQNSANEYGGPKDRYDPYRNQQMSKKGMYASQRHKALEELKALEKIDPEEEFKSASFGALVITSSQNLFLSVAVGKITIENKVIFAISINSPIGQAIINKKVNDVFEIKGKKHQIQEIY